MIEDEEGVKTQDMKNLKIRREALQDTLQQILDTRSGSTIVYFIGHLSSVAEHDPRAQGIRNGAWEAHKRGFCALVQRRVESEFEYIAQRR